MNAGIDQFGGTEDSASLLQAIRAGRIAVKRIDEAVLRVLVPKFELGLFENPYADESRVADVAGSASFVAAGRQAQAKSMVVLENKQNTLPVAAGKRVFLQGVSADAAQKAGFTVAQSLEHADIAIVRTATPHQMLHPNFFFGVRQHEGDLDFKEDNADLKAVRAAAAAKVPVVVAIYLDRPAILTNVAPHASAIIANFGATDEALFDALTGRVAPVGRLPFELPRSMDSVKRQRADMPHDSGDALYLIGAGGRY